MFQSQIIAANHAESTDVVMPRSTGEPFAGIVLALPASAALWAMIFVTMRLCLQ